MSGRKGGETISGGGGAAFQKEKGELAKEIVNENSFKYKRESEKEVKQFIQFAAEKKDGIVVNDEGRIVVKKSVDKAADELAEKLTDRIEFTDHEIAEKYQSLRDRLDRKYYIEPSQREEIDKFRDYQRNSIVDVVSSKLVKDKKTGKMVHPMELDSKYETLYNNGANQWGLTNPNGSAAKLRELNDTLRGLRSQIKYGVDDPRAQAELGATRSQIKQGIKDSLIENAGIAQVYYDGSKKKSSGGKKK